MDSLKKERALSFPFGQMSDKESNRNILDLKHEISKILKFRRNILLWFHVNGRSFPWRKKGLSKYKLVATEILLQRTRAETISGFFDIFYKQYPSWKALSNSSVDDIGKTIRPIGIWRKKATTLRSLATEMVNKNGRFPVKRKELESLPGVGQYIANSILLLCYGKPEPLLDGNMARVIERIFGPRKLSDIRYDPYLQSLSKTIVRGKRSKEINWAILDLASLVCKIRNPMCGKCPASSICSHFSHRKIESEREL